MPIAQPPAPNLTWTLDLPEKLKLAIADCVTLYSKIESCIIETIWLLENADLERKKKIARDWGDRNIKLVRRFIASIPNAQTNAIWPTLSQLRDERNLIAHGVWLMASDSRPMVVWHAKFLENDEWVGSEYFDWSRFDYFLDRGRLLLNTFFGFKKMLEEDSEILAAVQQLANASKASEHE